MRSLILFLSMTAACAAGTFEPLGFQKNPVARPPEPIITDRHGNGVGAGGAYSRTARGVIGPGGFQMEVEGGFIDPRGQFRPRIGPPDSFFDSPYYNRKKGKR